MPIRLSLSKFLASCLLISCAGCCYPKGYLLHGDLSLELNRVPWRQGPCGECGEAMESGGCGCGMPMDGMVMPEGVAETPTMSRFHTVPTKPAFSPTSASHAEYYDAEGGAVMEPTPAIKPASSTRGTPSNANTGRVQYSSKRRSASKRTPAQSNSWVFF